MADRSRGQIGSAGRVATLAAAADRALSRLLGADWPRTVEELEERKAKARGGPLASTG